MRKFCVIQANRLDERFNQMLQNRLVQFLGEQKEQWELFLDTCLYAYNTSWHIFSVEAVQYLLRGLNTQTEIALAQLKRDFENM